MSLAKAVLPLTNAFKHYIIQMLNALKRRSSRFSACTERPRVLEGGEGRADEYSAERHTESYEMSRL